MTCLGKFCGFGLLSLLLAAGAGCVAKTTIDGGNGSGGGGGSGAGGVGGAGGDAPNCALEQPGDTFEFQIHNTGSRELFLAYGCGTTMPIVLDTADGPLGIGAGNAESCEIPCEMVYDGYENWGCSDCGPGVGDALPPGASVTIEWDRRVFVSHSAPPACSGHEIQNGCGLGRAVDASVTSGTLEVCLGNDAFGYCYESEELPFTVDFAQASVSIDVQ